MIIHCRNTSSLLEKKKEPILMVVGLALYCSHIQGWHYLMN